MNIAFVIATLVAQPAPDSPETVKPTVDESIAAQTEETATPTPEQPASSEPDLVPVSAPKAKPEFAAGGALLYGSADGTSFGIRGEALWNRELIPNLRLAVDLTFYVGTSDGFNVPGLGAFEIDFRVTEINAIAHYWLFSKDEWRVYGLGGLGLAFLSTSVTGFTTDSVEGDTAFGLHGGGGVEYAIFQALHLYGEAKVSFYFGGSSSIDGAALDGVGNNLALAAGARYYFEL